uniref:DNA ligase (NAD(+)) n=1 Tax=Heterorhabditis bacteriophora TaxID=37862 RepID=A0A1I7XUY6_HETBA
MIGEQFGEEMSLICGLVCNVRNKGSKISVWTGDWSAEESNFKIGQVLKHKLMTADTPKNCPSPLFDALKYEDHDSCQKKSGSTVKARLTIRPDSEVLEKN